MLKTENDEGMSVGKADLAGAKADAFPFDRGEGDAEERRRHALKSLPQLVCGWPALGGSDQHLRTARS